MYLKRGILVLLVLTLFTQISIAQDNLECSFIITASNTDEACDTIWEGYLQIPFENNQKRLNAAISAVDSLQEDQNGFFFKDQIKECLREETSDINALISQLREENTREVRYKALEALSEYTNNELVIRALIDVSERNTDRGVRIEALVQLTQVVDINTINIGLLREVEDTLNDLMRDEDEGVSIRSSAGNSLIALNTERGLNFVISPIRNRRQSASLRANFVLFLGKSRFYDIAVPELIALSRLTDVDTASFLRKTFMGWTVGDDWFAKREIRKSAISSLGTIMSNLRNENTENSDELIEDIITALLDNIDYNLDYYLTKREEEQTITLLLRNIDIDTRIEEEFDNLIFKIPLTPSVVLDSMLEAVPLFRQVYSLLELEELPIYEQNSMSFAVYRYLLENHGETPTDSQILSAIIFIREKRVLFENRVILGPDKYFIHFTHEEERFSNTNMEEFARNRGVTNIAHSNLKGTSSKNIIRELIKNSTGPTVIWFDGHGGKRSIGLGNSGAVIEEQTEIKTNSIFHTEINDDLRDRGNLGEVILIFDSCFSYNFAENVLEDLAGISLPTIITATNKGQYGYGSNFLDSLISLNLQKGEPLLGRHIYESEEFSSSSQDSAVFFSDFGDYNEIALNNINHEGCMVCEGDSCPVNLETS